MSEAPKEMVGYPVNRGIDKYAEAFGMTRSMLFDWLKDKGKVLDVSAGGGLLRKETDILKKQKIFNSEVKIIPLDIIYATKNGMEFAQYATHLAFTDLGVTPNKRLISEIDESFAKDAVGASFTDLPFPDESFEGILASYSFGVHARDKEQLLKSYDELYRVLKTGGEALVSVVFDINRGTFSNYDKENPFIYSLDDLMIENVKLKRNTVTNEDGTVNDQFYLSIKK